jgi:uroporphyrinogen-III synthase
MMSGNAPLFLKKILVTRGARQSSSFSKQIAVKGGIPVESPLLAFRRMEEEERLQALHRLEDFQWLVFTSQNGIFFFMQLLHMYQINLQVLRKLKIAIVGKKTEQELEKYGLEASVIPEEYVAENLLHTLLPHLHPQDKVLVVRGSLGRTVVKDGLAERGYETEELIAYETVPNMEARQPLRELLMSGELDAITFTSSSTVTFFVEMVEDLPWQQLLKNCPVICIGPITAATAETLGMKEYLVPSHYTINGMIDVLIHHFSGLEENKEERE